MNGEGPAPHPGVRGLGNATMGLAFLTTFAVVSFRLFAGITSAMEVGSLMERLSAASWVPWALPLPVTELLLQRPRLAREA